MTESTKITLVKGMTDETDEDVISAFLEMAGDEIRNLADPHKSRERESVLEEYGALQAKAAAYYLNKRGWDGQLAHSENGISRSYESAGLPASITREITPICGVTK